MSSERGKSGNGTVYRGVDFCRMWFPKAHALKTCGCFKEERPRGVLVIQPRTGGTIR